MKPKMWMFATALVALMLCGTAMLSYAQTSSDNSTATQVRPAWKGHHGHMAYLAKQLDLTDAQKTQVKSIMQANRQANLPLYQQMAANRKALMAASADPNYDQAKVQALATQQSQLMAQKLVQKTNVQHQIYTQVLTPDQRIKADELRAKKMARIDRRLQHLANPQPQSSQQ